MASYLRLSVAVLFVVLMAGAVPRDKFKTCEQSSFCRRCRKQEPGKTAYELNLNTATQNDSSLTAELYNRDTGVYYVLVLTALKNGLFRLHVNEKSPLHPRYEVEHALQRPPQLARLALVEARDDKIVVASAGNRVELYANPFKVEFYSAGDLVVTANARGLMRFEHLRTKADKPEPPPSDHQEEDSPPIDPDAAAQQQQQDQPAAEFIDKPNNLPAAHDSSSPSLPGDGAENDPGAWDENFGSHHDSKPFGPEAVALDFSFAGAEHAYGIPEHADSFALRSTKGIDPYRLYNLDVFEYEVNERMALYGAVPVLYAHGKDRTTGVFWHNAAETWVDVASSADSSAVVESIVNYMSGATKKPQVDVHFMSESGVVDVFFLMGPGPMDAFRQFTELTGTAPLPPIFSLAYHQSRWNYNDQEDLLQIADNFDKYDLPLDVMWLDIEYTDGKKYFTWNDLKFPNPLEMVQNLTSKGRKLVVIIDPHIKRDDNYFLHRDATSNNYYVKHRDGKDYEGWCWPGSSSYLDFFDPRVREYYMSLYDVDKFKGTTNDVHIWNDMNEPSVFNGPEVTMPKDLVHYGGWEHRDLHNVNGMVYTIATYDALIKRSQGALRPFILSRSFFAGSQRYVAVWTGDNTAEWEHLRISYPMCMSLAISGISFCGADVGGFFKNPDAELFTRWYQAAAWLPFFRQHSHIDTNRREPWTFNDEVIGIVRESLRLRYSYLPYWYTLFREHELRGDPVLRPIWAHYPTETASYSIDDQLLVGDAILVKGVFQPAVAEVSVYFPGEGKVAWYDIDTMQKYGDTQRVVSLPVTLHRIPVFQRAGSIVARKMRIRRSTVAMRSDPYTLVVIADAEGKAEGRLYVDDEASFEYRRGEYLYVEMRLMKGQIAARMLDNKAGYKTNCTLERVDVVNPPRDVKMAVLRSEGTKLDLEVVYNPNNDVLTVRKPAVNMGKEWTIDLVA